MNKYINKPEILITSNKIILDGANPIILLTKNNGYEASAEAEEILQNFEIPSNEENINFVKNKIEAFLTNKEEISLINTIKNLKEECLNKPIRWDIDEIAILKDLQKEIKDTFPDFISHIHEYEDIIVKRSFQSIQILLLQVIIENIVVPFQATLESVIKSRGHFFSWDIVYLEHPNRNIIKPETIKHLVYLYKESMAISRVKLIIQDWLYAKPKDFIVNKKFILDQEIIEKCLSHPDTIESLSHNLLNFIKNQNLSFNFEKFQDDENLSIKYIEDFEGLSLFLGVSDQIHILKHNKTNITISEIEDTLKNPEKVWISHKDTSLNDKVYQKGDKQIATLGGIIKTASKSDKLKEGYSILYAELGSDGYNLYDFSLAILINAKSRTKGEKSKFEIFARGEQEKNGVKYSDIRVPGTTKENLAPENLKTDSELNVFVDGVKIDTKDFNLKIVSKFIPKKNI